MAADLQHPPRRAAQVVRRVLFRQNIAIDTATAQLVVATYKTTALHADAPSPPPRRRRRVLPADCEPLF